jgi:hypothetical protein
MSDLFFLIQEDIFGEETILLKNALDKHSIKHASFIEGLNGAATVFPRGSIEFIEDFERSWGEYCCSYGLTINNYDYCAYSKPINHLMVNNEFIVLPWWKLEKSLSLISKLFGDRFFIRPNSGKKIFTGTTLGLKHFYKELDIIKNLPSSSIKEEDLVVIAKEQKIDSEYRLLMHNNKIISYSLYKEIPESNYNDEKLFDYLKSYQEDKDQIEKDFSNIVSEIKNYPDLLYTLDIAFIGEEARILELNSAVSAGWYDMDYEKVVKYLVEINEAEE